ncbi:hypothetical protein BOFE_09430 (plasmid) [Candidatus Borrelia fainii]|uniref:Uncharacterized protein n=1 Tax=Candidatus Borrelia fainii TaxID=2518322 RepID=A0ABM8DLK0_9SPIR|nr:hypothetical protein [Candidatus Borrelia fainii]BDU63403.1 hypothetical protein BOFE_09430 [Candidatus Borrelia fainii]
MGIYEVLSDQEKLVVDEIREIVTDDRIGIGEDYKTYTIPDFRALLNELGYVKVQKIIQIYLDVKKSKIEVVDIINNLKDEELKLRLETECNNRWNNYLLRLKKLFNKFDGKTVYANFIDNGYTNEFTKLQIRLHKL